MNVCCCWYWRFIFFVFCHDEQVPFGHVPAVKDFLKLNGIVNKPKFELQTRPIHGLDCGTAEQSGKRFWSLIEKICGDAETFFKDCFVYNLCPLAFFKSSGTNVTPTEIKVRRGIYFFDRIFFFF